MNRCPEHNKDSSVCVCVCVLQCNSILEPELAELTCGIHPSCTKRASWQPTILFFPLLLDSQAFGSLQLAQGIRSLKLLNHEARDVRRALYFGHNRKFARFRFRIERKYILLVKNFGTPCIMALCASLRRTASYTSEERYEAGSKECICCATNLGI
ncbi:uncharacterized protein LOC110833907 isoform X2 [Zootermopsis nevadensis]|uniref:uncharacterized protein LOC110833907 isoform X2 n=1 Tax=Zootermopsis nevadensis TaxID=136037 RepID=UPI000B8EA51B|nr:uncharacterized protein LOC110833907 isoform X2 [Zootermopsis nevadensis]